MFIPSSHLFSSNLFVIFKHERKHLYNRPIPSLRAFLAPHLCLPVEMGGVPMLRNGLAVVGTRRLWARRRATSGSGQSCWFTRRSTCRYRPQPKFLIPHLVGWSVGIGVQRGRGGATVLRPHLLGHFAKDFTRRVYFSQYSHPPRQSPPLF